MINSDYTYIGESIRDFFIIEQYIFNNKYPESDPRRNIIHGDFGDYNYYKWKDNDIIRGKIWSDLPKIGISLTSGTLFKTPEWAKRKT